jgi:FeS assembly SUF system protein
VSPHPGAYAGAVAPQADPDRTLALKAEVVEAIRGVYDPEIPVNIYELGLIYDVVIDASSVVHVTMTLTSPMCPSAQQLPADVQARVRVVPGVQDAVVEIVWEPPWTAELMSDVARLHLGL